jgi:hypothetical protein
MWAWLIGHWIYVWVGVGLALDGIAQVLPAGPVQRVLQALAHISPASLFSAVKALQAGPTGGAS